MGTAERKSRMSVEEYFAYEESMEGMAEYFDGEIFDMSGGSLTHSLITANLTIQVGSQLHNSPCTAYTPDARLQIEAANTFVRPDLWVVCGSPDLMPNRSDTARNATLVAEVLSSSTSNFDRTGKFARYRLIPSLREYVLVEQTHPQVDLFFKNDQGIWEFTSITEMDDTVTFRSIGATVRMADLYNKVEFTEQA
jgi:Uma2 family endonuclease